MFWTSDDGGVRQRLKMAAAESDDAVLVTLENGKNYRIRILSRPLPLGTGVALFYRCPWCGKPRRYLYLGVDEPEPSFYLGLGGYARMKLS